MHSKRGNSNNAHSIKLQSILTHTKLYSLCKLHSLQAAQSQFRMLHGSAMLITVSRSRESKDSYTVLTPPSTVAVENMLLCSQTLLL